LAVRAAFTVHPTLLIASATAKRFRELVVDGFYDGVGFTRVNKMIVQFGISPDTEKEGKWNKRRFADGWYSFVTLSSLIFLFVSRIDPKIWERGKGGFPAGTISFAGFDGGESRTCQVFITFSDNVYLGKNAWETPFGRVINGMESVQAIFKGYGGSDMNELRVCLYSG
jgi:cyclophilin family peptidyl-prolyl cis-trans isomerase